MKRALLYVQLLAACLTILFGGKMNCLAEEIPYGDTSMPCGNNKENETTLDTIQLYARSAVLMDADSGRVLFEKEGEAALPMASTTKIMTCILALENGNQNDLVEVSDYAASMPKVKLHMQKGESYRLEDLLYSLMLESHNDSAVAIAEHVGGSVEGFADLMNKKAREIGCEHTYFITPNGLDAEKEGVCHSTTARDLALIMSYCIKRSPEKEAFLAITRTPSYSFTNADGSRSFSCHNHNAFLNMMEGALSGKTGFTGKAGYCYVGSLVRDDRTFVVALLACGWPNNKSYKWSDTKKLMQYGIDHFKKKNLAEEPVSDDWLKKIPVWDAKTDRLFGKAFVNVSIRDEKEAPVLLMKEGEEIQVECTVERQLSAPVEKDAAVGKIKYLLNGTVVWERAIRTNEACERVDFFWFLKMASANFAL